jgi:uncharacterized protein with NRDE domain
VCTLILAWRVFDETPICVAANRDEAGDRPSSPPFRWDSEPPILAPRDDRAGGTWLGYNAAGVLVAVTNRWELAEGERSRGLLVTDALGERSAEAAIETVGAELCDREYEPFHLLVADETDCLLVVHGADHDVVHALEPGVHTIVNVGFDGEWFVPETRPEVGRTQAENAEQVGAELEERDGKTAAEWTERAGDVLGDHDYGVCVHGDGFGTQSSSLLRLGAERTFEFADGPPCETTFRMVPETV